MKLTNSEILKLCSDDESFEKITSKLTKEIFTQKGYEQLRNNDYKGLSDFFYLSIRVVLNQIDRPEPNIPDAYRAIVKEYSNEEGGIFQRINTSIPSPISPRFRKLVNGGSVDPFKVRKPVTSERFYRQNFDFQNLLTMQTIELKKMFLSETGIYDYVSSILSGLDESYYIQKYEVMRDMINLAINSTNSPLQASQIIQVPDITEISSNDDMAQFVRTFRNLKNLFTSTVMSGKFNAKGFRKGLYVDRHVLLIRSEVLTQIQTTLMATSFHVENLGLEFKVIPVKDFGGIYYTDENDNVLKPIYDEDFGDVIGFNTTGVGEPLPDNEVFAKDPNENVEAILAERGVIFSTQMQPYEIKSIYNPAGDYTNYWANQPNGAFNYDANYNLIKFIKETQTEEPEEP